MRLAPLIPLLAAAGALLTPTPSLAGTTCSMHGPAWTVHPAHGNSVYHGTTYRVVAFKVGCATAKGHVRGLFAKNPSWPYAGSGSTTLKGTPPGWTCRSTVPNRRNRKNFSGDCLSGTGPSDVRHFSWAPKMPKI